MARKPGYSADCGVIDKPKDQESALIEAVAKFVNDPLGFVHFIFPWGEGLLAGETGPDTWQTKALAEVGRASKLTKEAVRIAVRSGHGIGKTSLISWLILWCMSTRPNANIVVTANTSVQLESKTWRELAKWHNLSINKHWHKWTATKFYNAKHPETWFAKAIPWSKEKSDSFAGTHDKHVFVFFDEASAIEDIIWDVAEGAMTTTGAMWIAFGNPTKNTGRFSECFKKYRNRWFTMEIDSRTSKQANQNQIQQWKEDYGEDSDFFRVRVKGQEPRTSTDQFIPGEYVDGAYGRKVHFSVFERSPKIMGVDVARQGDDSSVIAKRQGLYTYPLIKMKIDDNMDVAGRVALEINEFKPDAVFIDQGAGVGVIDRLRQLGHTVIEIPFGSKATDGDHYFNKRAEMWGRMKDWLRQGGCIPEDKELRDDLLGPQYGFGNARGLIQLEKKEDMKDRGLASPDAGDALALTFAQHVHSSQKYERESYYRPSQMQEAESWNPNMREYR